MSGWIDGEREMANVLIGCEYSATVRDAFIKRGHDAWSNDIIDCEKGGPHLKMDIMDALMARHWDIVIIHIPCTYMAVCGNGTYANTEARFEALEWSCRVWDQAKLTAKRVVMENPASVLFPALRDKGADVQYIQPWQFGHPEQKKTGLALHNAPRLKPTKDVREHMMTLPTKERERIWYMSPGPDRQKERARFFPGIADAMAEQWG